MPPGCWPPRQRRPSPQIRGTLKSWTKLWCVLKPGVLLIYKTPKVGQWVGTVLLHCCELIERPSKKDGFCFKLFHPLDQSVWAVKVPRGPGVQGAGPRGGVGPRGTTPGRQALAGGFQLGPSPLWCGGCGVGLSCEPLLPAQDSRGSGYQMKPRNPVRLGFRTHRIVSVGVSVSPLTSALLPWSFSEI